MTGAGERAGIPASFKRRCATARAGSSSDGEAVLLGVDGIADFNGRLHSRKHDGKVQFYAFDPRWAMETISEIGPDLLHAACRAGGLGGSRRPGQAVSCWSMPALGEGKEPQRSQR